MDNKGVFYMKKRYDFHTHTLLSDGVLLLSEQISWAKKKNYGAIGITDHADASNIDEIMKKLQIFIEKEEIHYDIQIIPGVELTHCPPKMIDNLAKEAKQKGAKIVIVHGETVVEPVPEGTNKAAIESEYVDILAHPGLIEEELVELAAKNGTYLEISTRRGHSLTNGHVAKLALEKEAKLLVNSDVHTPDNFLDYEEAETIALGAGIPEDKIEEIMQDNPIELLNKIG
jgi:histidinol phosphatase-like PHP family hydrolase